MDYLVIGSNGFAQVGNPDFHEKNRIEMRVLMEYMKTNFPIPDEFCFMCDYRIKWFIHDFGRYSEIVVVYDNYILNQWDEDDSDKFNKFWNWFNDIESVNLESDFLNKVILNRYRNCLTESNLKTEQNDNW